MELHLFNTTDRDFIKHLSVLFLSYKKRNISKSYAKSAMALCVSDTAKIGIDIEEEKERSLQTMEHFVKKFITFQVKKMPSQLDVQWFYKAWTAMESYFKLDGAGFGTPKDFVLDLEQKSIWRDGREVAWINHFDVGNFLICICSDTPFLKNDVKLSYHGWED